MLPLPAPPILTSNRGTWAVATCQLAAIGNWMHDVLPNEVFDPHFRGQELATSYFDTARFTLRKARRQGGPYLTLRVRRYCGSSTTYALSAKTETQKFRVQLPDYTAELLQDGEEVQSVLLPLLPADLQARLLQLAGDQPLVSVVCVSCRRYAVEDEEDRFTLDVDVATDLGKRLPYGVLEFKSVAAKPPPDHLRGLGLRPIKLSKFLWATEP